ncbi:hypothetical protein BDZ89DRAFT_1076137, partial [Hymenopellis radicata]
KPSEKSVWQWRARSCTNECQANRIENFRASASSEESDELVTAPLDESRIYTILLADFCSLSNLVCRRALILF